MNRAKIESRQICFVVWTLQHELMSKRFDLLWKRESFNDDSENDNVDDDDDQNILHFNFPTQFYFR